MHSKVGPNKLKTIFKAIHAVEVIILIHFKQKKGDLNPGCLYQKHQEMPFDLKVIGCSRGNNYKMKITKLINLGQ